MIKKKIKTYKKESGTLLPFSFKEDVPFKAKRVFVICGKKGFIRAKHAHFKCSQYIIPVTGKIELECEHDREKTKTILDPKNKNGYLLKPITWCKIKFLTNNSVIMVFCDMEYEYSDYINSYKDFLKYKK
jgi:dTDP-4-dehydrorhamnose 3,5-epimerase-like enzyme